MDKYRKKEIYQQLKLRQLGRGLILNSLPAIGDLYELYREYNNKFFCNQLPRVEKVRIEWSNRLSSSAGICYSKSKIIRLSRAYHIKHIDDVGSTLLHEMIHLKIRGHGVEFKRELKRIQNLGGKVYRYSKEAAKVPRWIYTCKNCNIAIKKYKRYPKNIICGKCRGKFKEEFIFNK